MHTWEELSREWLLRAGVMGGLPFAPDRVGSVWTRSAQVDVVGINRMEKTLFLGECKWGTGESGRKVLTTLVEKTGEVVPSGGTWQVYYLGFDRAGWTAAAQDYARTVGAGAGDAPAGNWTVAGFRLVTLEELDADLARWT
jgi:hypothetical protein